MLFAVSFAVYTLAIVAIGIASARHAHRSDADYFLAGRRLGPWVAALSASASSESGWVTLGLVGWAFTSGYAAYWIIPGCLVGFVVNWFVIAGRMRDRSHELEALTLADFFAFNFAERVPILRILCVIVILTAMWLYVAAQFAAAGKAFSAAFTDLPYWAGVVIGTVIVLLYTVVGGFRATCWTDFAQGVVMVFTLVAFPVYLLANHGGFEFISAQLAATDSDALLSFWPQKTGAALVGFLLGSGALGINFGFVGQPHVLVRFMAMRDRRDAIMAGVISVTWGALILWGAVTVGLIVRALTEAGGMEWTAGYTQQLADGVAGAGETGLVLSAKHLIPGVLSGMVLAAVLAAICSTADSQLVVAASAGANDIYARLIGKSRRSAHMIVNRFVVFGLGLGAMLLVFDEEVQVFKFVLDFGWAVLGASFGPQLLLILLWKRASYAGCVAGMLAGFVTALTWPHVNDGMIGDVPVYNLPLAFMTALIVNVVVSLAVPSRRAV
ncbi:MAG: sodium/proline symporter [Planctomycetota bacterium]|jgi:sodium/proline symporter